MSFPAVDNLPPIHPGEILRDELAALHLSARRFAEHIGVPSNAVSEILNGKRRVTAQMALRLARAFDVSPDYWMSLQNLYDSKRAQAEIGEAVAAIAPLTHAAA